MGPEEVGLAELTYTGRGPETITVDDAKSARAVVTDGGVVVLEPRAPDSDAETIDADLPADTVLYLHGIVAKTTSTVDDLPDFDVYCVAVELAFQQIRRFTAQEVTFDQL